MKTKKLILTALFAALTAAGAFIKIPTPPVSFTLQVFFTVLAGILLGPWYGALSQAVYVLLGLVGLPIFTAGGGFSYVFNPTFGFLLGLIPMAMVTGLIARRTGPKFWSLLLAGAAGLAALYAVGLPWLHVIQTVYLENAAWTLQNTFVGGMLIFLPWDALKLVVAALLGCRLVPRLGLAAKRA